MSVWESDLLADGVTHPQPHKHLGAETKARMFPNLTIDDWTSVISTNCPQQTNDKDWGVCLLKVAHGRSPPTQFNFDERNVPCFRALMTLEQPAPIASKTKLTHRPTRRSHSRRPPIRRPTR